MAVRNVPLWALLRDWGSPGRLLATGTTCARPFYSRNSREILTLSGRGRLSRVSIASLVSCVLDCQTRTSRDFLEGAKPLCLRCSEHTASRTYLLTSRLVVVCVCLPKYVLGGSTSLGPGLSGGAAPRVAGPYNSATEPAALTGFTTRFGRCGEPRR